MTSAPISGARNTFESTVGGLTVGGRAHGLGAWFALALRLVMGSAFAYSGFTKLVAAGPFDAEGYLVHGAATNGNPLAGLFAWTGSTPPSRTTTSGRDAPRAPPASGVRPRVTPGRAALTGLSAPATSDEDCGDRVLSRLLTRPSSGGIKINFSF